MPTNDADAIAEVAALCAAARAKLPASGFRRLHVLLDMILIDLGHAAPPPTEAASDLRPDAMMSEDRP
jgi:ATP-dependent protease HslVU (ClpYQ) ATPase subunit